MTATFEAQKEQQKERKQLLTKAFTALRKNKFKIARLTKADDNNMLKVWNLACENLGYDDIEVMCQNNPNLIICRRISATKTKMTKELVINFNGVRKDIVETLKSTGLEVVNENDDSKNAIVVKLVD